MDQLPSPNASGRFDANRFIAYLQGRKTSLDGGGGGGEGGADGSAWLDAHDDASRHHSDPGSFARGSLPPCSTPNEGELLLPLFYSYEGRDIAPALELWRHNDRDVRTLVTDLRPEHVCYLYALEHLDAFPYGGPWYHGTPSSVRCHDRVEEELRHFFKDLTSPEPHSGKPQHGGSAGDASGGLLSATMKLEVDRVAADMLRAVRRFELSGFVADVISSLSALAEPGDHVMALDGLYRVLLLQRRSIRLAYRPASLSPMDFLNAVVHTGPLAGCGGRPSSNDAFGSEGDDGTPWKRTTTPGDALPSTACCYVTSGPRGYFWLFSEELPPSQTPIMLVNASPADAFYLCAFAWQTVHVFISRLVRLASYFRDRGPSRLPTSNVELQVKCRDHLREHDPFERLLDGAAKWLDTAKVRFRSRNVDKALSLCTEGLMTCPVTAHDTMASLHLSRAICHVHLNQPVPALRDCERALSHDRHCWRAYTKRALIVLSLAAPAAAGVSLEAALPCVLQDLHHVHSHGSEDASREAASLLNGLREWMSQEAADSLAATMRETDTWRSCCHTLGKGLSGYAAGPEPAAVAHALTSTSLRVAPDGFMRAASSGGWVNTVEFAVVLNAELLRADGTPRTNGFVPVIVGDIEDKAAADDLLRLAAGRRVNQRVGVTAGPTTTEEEAEKALQELLAEEAGGGGKSASSTKTATGKSGTAAQSPSTSAKNSVGSKNATAKPLSGTAQKSSQGSPGPAAAKISSPATDKAATIKSPPVSVSVPQVTPAASATGVAVAPVAPAPAQPATATRKAASKPAAAAPPAEEADIPTAAAVTTDGVEDVDGGEQIDDAAAPEEEAADAESKPLSRREQRKLKKQLVEPAVAASGSKGGGDAAAAASGEPAPHQAPAPPLAVVPANVGSIVNSDRVPSGPAASPVVPPDAAASRAALPIAPVVTAAATVSAGTLPKPRSAAAVSVGADVPAAAAPPTDAKPVVVAANSHKQLTSAVQAASIQAVMQPQSNPGLPKPRSGVAIVTPASIPPPVPLASAVAPHRTTAPVAVGSLIAGGALSRSNAGGGGVWASGGGVVTAASSATPVRVSTLAAMVSGGAVRSVPLTTSSSMTPTLVKEPDAVASVAATSMVPKPRSAQQGSPPAVAGSSAAAVPIEEATKSNRAKRREARDAARRGGLLSLGPSAAQPIPAKDHSSMAGVVVGAPAVLNPDDDDEDDWRVEANVSTRPSGLHHQHVPRAFGTAPLPHSTAHHQAATEPAGYASHGYLPPQHGAGMAAGYFSHVGDTTAFSLRPEKAFPMGGTAAVRPRSPISAAVGSWSTNLDGGGSSTLSVETALRQATGQERPRPAPADRTGEDLFADFSPFGLHGATLPGFSWAPTTSGYGGLMFSAQPQAAAGADGPRGTRAAAERPQLPPASHDATAFSPLNGPTLFGF